MQRQQLELDDGFRVVAGNAGSQAAVMVLAAGDSTGGPDNRHDDGDQWLFVVEGTGEAVIDRETTGLRQGTLLLIERGEAHEIRNTGHEPLRTLNFYVPPVY